MFDGAYRGRRVLVTGHTGFKGGWLCAWLAELGAEVWGLALPPPTTPHLFGALGLASRLRHRVADLRDAAAVRAVVAEAAPQLVFHLGAQSLVRRSYLEPGETWAVNVGGTLNLLEALRVQPGVEACVVVTSDKCYENQDWPWGYRESDPMGGHDPYSASKAAAELLVASHRRSFAGQGPRLATARAGNVIGGGDWAPERIVTDLVAAIAAGRPLALRNPRATRPWQHVLEPLSGYLLLGQRLLRDPALASGWNFGPGDAATVTVEELARSLVGAWGRGSVVAAADAASQPHEARQLRLDCSKARDALGWSASWELGEAVARTAAWYRAHAAGEDLRALTLAQIAAYAGAARARGAAWAADAAAAADAT